MRKYWFTILLTTSLALAAVIHVSAGSIDRLSSLRMNLTGSEWLQGDSIDTTGSSDETSDAGATDGAREANGADTTNDTSVQNGADTTNGTSVKNGADTTNDTSVLNGADATGGAREANDADATDGAREANAADATDSSSGANGMNAEEASDKDKARLAEDAGQTTDIAPPAINLQPGQRPEPPENFDGVLFVGDSRTMGLSEYGDLGNSVVFANTGMSVYNVLTARISSGGEKRTLDEVLSNEHFQMIYLMLGINELGYDMPQTIKQYKEVVDKIKEKQPEVIMVLEANLHTTSEKSKKSPVYSNSKINGLNQEIKRIAEENSCYYIDVNEIFDDDGGSLNQAYTTDGSHVLGKYYADWVKWLKG